MGISKIPFITFLYIYTFLQIKLSQQADGDVKRLVRTDAFLINGRNTLTLEKCPDNTEFVYLQAFGLCKKNVNNFNGDSKVWMVPEHVDKPKEGEDKKQKPDPPEKPKNPFEESENPLIRAYHKFCKESFESKKKCELSINKAEATSDRFRTEIGLDCEGQGASIFNGVLFCIETNGSPVEENEEVTLVGFKGRDIEASCPEDRKIKTLTAFETSSPLVNKGMVESFYGEATKQCDGNEKCTLSVDDKDKFKRFRVFTYKCVE